MEQLSNLNCVCATAARFRDDAAISTQPLLGPLNADIDMQTVFDYVQELYMSVQSDMELARTERDVGHNAFQEGQIDALYQVLWLLINHQ